MTGRLPDDFDATIVSLGADDVLSGRYRLVRELGRGGMGVVWLASDETLDGREVAVKLLPTGLSRDKRAIGRLKQEAQKSLDLSHPHIVRLVNFEQDASRGGLAYLVMQYVRGETLNDRLADHPEGLPLQAVLPWANQLASALDHAHEQGVLHRDIKPSNVMVDAAGKAYLMDFGIAREAKDTMTRLTGRDSSGTLPYMSVQQILGQNSPSNDIYSFAATLYEALNGEPPFTTGDLVEQIRHVSPSPIEGLPGHVNDALLAGLAKDPEDRPESAAAFFRGLEEHAQLPRRAAGEEPHPRAGVPVLAKEPGDRPESVVLPPEVTEERPQGTRPAREMLPPRGHSLRYKLPLAMLFVFLLGVGWGLLRLERSKSTVANRAQTEKADAAETRARAEGSGAPPVSTVKGGSQLMFRRGLSHWPASGENRLFYLTNTGETTTVNVVVTAGGKRYEGQLKIPFGRSAITVAEFVTALPGAPSYGDDWHILVGRTAFTIWGTQGGRAPIGFRIIEGDAIQGWAKRIREPRFGIDFMLIKSGSFQMGSNDGDSHEKRVHPVKIGRPFYLARTEVTQRQWAAVMGNNPSHFKGPDRPVEQVSWDDCREFVQKLNAKAPAGWSFALPSEAQWEYACRAGTKGEYSFVGDERELGDYAWYGENSKGRTHDVGTTKLANPWGLLDMHGNVIEWCEDRYAWGGRVLRVLRGGSWDSGAAGCRSAYRNGERASNRDVNLGFRPAMVVTTK